jgi:malonyl CoA-acyl carrier protein transacylase
MGAVQVFDFGCRNGMRNYRITGEKEDLERIIEECRDADANFHFTPQITKVRKGQWMISLALKMPLGVGEKVD